MSVQLILALLGIALILFGKIVIYRASKEAFKEAGPGSVMERINADPKKKAAYRFGHVQYILGMVVFAASFLIK